MSVKIEPADPDDLTEDATTLKSAITVKEEKVKEEPSNDLPINEANGDGLIKKGLIFDSDSENIVFGFVRDPMVMGSCGSHLAPGSYEEMIQTKQYACDWCSKMFVNRFDVIKHNLEHLRVYLIGQKMHQCDFCRAIFTEEKHLTIHTLKHNSWQSSKDNKKRISDQLHECELCSKTFKYKHWHEHMKTVHNEGMPNTKWKCSICFKIFKCERYLFRHILYIHEEHKPDWMKRKERSKSFSQNLKCKLCSKVFKNEDCLTHHFKNVHKDEGKKFSCTICASVMKSNAYLRTHMQRVHNNEIPQPCKICGKSFISLRYLRVHEKNTHFKMQVKNKIDIGKVNVKRNTDFHKQLKEDNDFEEVKATKNFANYIKGTEFAELQIVNNTCFKKGVNKDKGLLKNNNIKKVKNNKEFEIKNAHFKVTKENDFEELKCRKNTEIMKDNNFEQFDIIPSSLSVADSKVRIIDWKDM